MKFDGHKYLKIVPCDEDEPKYYGVSNSLAWRNFLKTNLPTILPGEGWSKTINNLSHRLCGQEAKLALLAANAMKQQTLRPSIEHSLIHDFFFNTYSIFEGVFTIIANKGKPQKLPPHSWKERASEILYSEPWGKGEKEYGEGTKLLSNVISLRDRVHQDSSNSKELEFSEQTYSTTFRDNLNALSGLFFS